MNGAHRTDKNGTNFIDKIIVTKMFNQNKPDPIFIPKRKFKGGKS